jgi:hypothetical protein
VGGGGGFGTCGLTLETARGHTVMGSFKLAPAAAAPTCGEAGARSCLRAHSGPGGGSLHVALAYLDTLGLFQSSLAPFLDLCMR